MNELKNTQIMYKVTELFKCHFSAKETAAILELSYAVVINIYRGLKFAKIKQYDRLTLSECIDDELFIKMTNIKSRNYS